MKFHEPKDAIKLKWRCFCGKIIKKGADYRIHELADLGEGKHPEHRPESVYIIPLSEIIALAYGISNAWSLKVQAIWRKFVDFFGNEITVLLETDVKEIEKIDKKVGEYIKYFREGKIKYIPGGAGVYGKLVKPGEEVRIDTFKMNQKSLKDF